MAYQSELAKLKRRYEEKPSQWFAALAEEHRRAGDVEVALQMVRKGLENRSNYVSGHIVLARCLLDRAEDAEAQQELERVLELDGENVIALKVLSEIAERLGDPVGARGWVDRLLEVDPMNEEAQLMMSRLADVSAATAEPSSGTDVAEPEAAEEESPPSPAEPEAPEAAEAEKAAEAESPPSPLSPLPSPAEPAPPAPPAITGADVEHDAPLELSPEAGEGPPPEDLVGVQVDRPEPIELVGGPGMVVGQDQSGELIGRAEEETGEQAESPEEVAPSTGEPEPVVTQTMAEVYVKQGLIDSALKVYRELLAQRPEDPQLLSRIAELEGGAPAPKDAPADSEKPQYLASKTGGVSTRAFLAAVIAAGPPPPPSNLPPPTSPGSGERGVGRGEEGGSREEAGVSFDEFFGGTAPKQKTTESSEPPEAKGDDADFKDWLEGLKS
ncbi:MAG: tetratricopeptide repeat protein [Gemmatimonadetes bacterium]|nr:tetratricopeptide repeat protein [Gemmatimonadota bacterium]